MASERVKRKQQQHNGSHTAAYAACFFLLVGLLTAAGLALDEQGGLLGFVAKCELYLLGKGSFALPLTCLLLSWKLFVEGKLSLWQDYQKIREYPSVQQAGNFAAYRACMEAIGSQYGK